MTQRNLANQNPASRHGHGLGGTRRDFLGKAGLVAGSVGLIGLPPSRSLADEPDDCTPPASPTPAVQFTPDGSSSLQTRKNAANLTSSEVDRLKAAYAALRKLTKDDPKDPRGWLQQANLHCWYCGGGSGGQAGEEIHGSWWFFPWHRCYLYFHERILGKLIGDQTFRLAYWDWANPTDRALPDPFTNPNDATNPLFDANRGTKPSSKLPDSLVGSRVMSNVMGQRNYQRFMGTDADGPVPQGGRMENGPHGAVHLWVGSPGNLSLSVPDMGVLATAAQDPVFFAHHSNIDRIWDVWLNTTTAVHTNPTLAKWLNHRWTFYDENKKLISISVRDVLDYKSNLFYRYENASMAEHQLVEFATQGPQTELTPEPVTVKARELEPAALSRLQSARPQVAAQRSNIVLHIDGIEIPPNRGALVRVFVNDDHANAKTSFESANFVGYFSIVAKTSKMNHAMKGHRPTNVALDITDKIGELLKERRELSVTLVPIGPVDDKPESIKLSFKKVYISEEK